MLSPKDPEDGPLGGIIKTIALLPAGKAKTQLGTLVTMGVKSVEDFQTNVETWFNDAMRGVSQVYAERMRRIVVLISFVLVMAGNLDTIAIAEALWQAPATRELVGHFIFRIIQLDYTSGKTIQQISGRPGLGPSGSVDIISIQGRCTSPGQISA